MLKCWNSFGTPCVEMSAEWGAQAWRFGRPRHVGNLPPTERLTA
jgi:hypothetical protein